MNEYDLNLQGTTLGRVPKWEHFVECMCALLGTNKKLVEFASKELFILVNGEGAHAQCY